MISKEMILTFMQKGFRYIQSNVKGVTLLYRENEDGVNVCALVDDVPSYVFKAEDFEDIAFQVERKLLLSGYRNIDTMFFIYSDHPERIKNFTSHKELKFWIMDMLAKRIIIYENQPDDYFSLKNELENVMIANDKKKEKVIDKIPFVTLGIVSVNIIIYLVMSLTDPKMFMELGGSYWRYVFYNGEIYRLLTSMFIHFDITHLVNNVIILILAGNQLEAAAGRLKFLLIYFVSGIGASLISAMYFMYINDAVLSAGASGAIYGVIGAMAAIMLRNKKRMSSMMGAQFFVLLAFIIFDGMTRINTDFMAHLGGFAIGLILTFIMYKSRINIYKVS